MTSLAWLDAARSHLGEREIPGAAHSSKILAWWRAIKRGGIRDDEIPWCAAFVGACLESVGIRSTRFESAKSYLTWGVGLTEPCLGCIAILDRAGGGHVGFVVGRSPLGRLLVLGGNQDNAVSIKAFPIDRLLAYRWPAGEAGLGQRLPATAREYETSINEH